MGMSRSVVSLFKN